MKKLIKGGVKIYVTVLCLLYVEGREVRAQTEDDGEAVITARVIDSFKELPECFSWEYTYKFSVGEIERTAIFELIRSKEKFAFRRFKGSNDSSKENLEFLLTFDGEVFQTLSTEVGTILVTGDEEKIRPRLLGLVRANPFFNVLTTIADYQNLTYTELFEAEQWLKLLRSKDSNGFDFSMEASNKSDDVVELTISGNNGEEPPIESLTRIRFSESDLEDGILDRIVSSTSFSGGEPDLEEEVASVGKMTVLSLDQVSEEVFTVPKILAEQIWNLDLDVHTKIHKED